MGTVACTRCNPGRHRTLIRHFSLRIPLNWHLPRLPSSRAPGSVRDLRLQLVKILIQDQGEITQRPLSGKLALGCLEKTGILCIFDTTKP